MNIELFDDAMEFIASLSDSQLKLHSWQDLDMERYIITSSSQVECGTIACAAGWLTLNPQFEALGLKVGVCGVPTFKNQEAYWAMADLFNLPYRVAVNLFSRRGFDDADTFSETAMENMTDRQLWLSRARIVRARTQQELDLLV
jgi:hypothetical protein